MICAGGGGVPTAVDPATGLVRGVEAVVDKDRTSAVLALDIAADRLVIATDVSAVQADWGTADARAIATAHPDELDSMVFAEGSMGPKIAAASSFARSGKGDAVIGSLAELGEMLAGRAGTVISTSRPGLTFRGTPPSVVETACVGAHAGQTAVRAGPTAVSIPSRQYGAPHGRRRQAHG